VPISYAGRTYAEGKKIGFKDAVLGRRSMFHWWLIDDLYKPDEYGSNILVSLARCRTSTAGWRTSCGRSSARACSSSARASGT
jgi:hypothetical protein